MPNLRIFAAALSLETNTFAKVPTSYQAFLDRGHYPPGSAPENPTLHTSVMWVARQRSRREVFTLIEGSAFSAQPGGPPRRQTYERLRDQILSELREAAPVDAVVLNLHGAMVAEDYDDCEGDVLEHIRAIVGPSCVIGILLDPHCHLTKKRCELADLIVLMREYPHTDFVPRAEELLRLVLDCVEGRIKPRISLFDCRMIVANFFTSIQPMRGIVDKIGELEKQEGILSISIAHGWGHGDVPEVGTRILVITDDRKERGDAVAAEIGRDMIAIRSQGTPPLMSVDDAIQAALRSPNGPVVISDGADNAGGGAPSDNTTFIHRLHVRHVPAAIGPIWDPIAVSFAFEAGVGATIPLRIGGKAWSTSGVPFDADVEVIACQDEAVQTFAGTTVRLGRAVSVRAGSLDLVLISNRAQAMGVDLFTNLGIDPVAKKIVVVKSEQHFYAAYTKIASEVIYAQSDAPLIFDVEKLPWSKPQRPIWPLDRHATPEMLI